jgi:NADH-ubiquinone oxidoreductase chain 4
LRFIIKFPIYFLHLWLPKAHVEAPTTARILLAGLLLKLGTAGFFRIIGRINFIHNNIWLIISFLGIIIGSFCCVFQSDSKSLAAYSSVTHIRFLLLGLVFIRIRGKISGLILILAHGYTSTLIFYLIGEFYHTSGRRIIYFINRFLRSSLILGILFSLVFLSNSGVPPSLSFLSEFLVITNRIVLTKYTFLIIFIYFLISFYYSLFLITNSLIGKLFLNVNS